jgi:hypothetical protein
VLSYPPSLRPLAGDKDAVSAAQFSPDGAVQLYLNATPRQGTESLRQWAAFRLTLLRSDDAATAHEITAAEGVKFRGGTGSCVIDNYVTRTGEHHYEEIACLVQGQASASVIVAAAPAAMWAGPGRSVTRRSARRHEALAAPAQPGAKYHGWDARTGSLSGPGSVRDAAGPSTRGQYPHPQTVSMIVSPSLRRR